MPMRHSTPITVTLRDRDRLCQVVDVFSAKRYDALVDFLRFELQRATIVPSERAHRELATMNSRLRVRDNQTGAIFTVSLVYPGAEDRWLGRVSVLSATGAALLGLSQGQTIDWIDMGGRRKSLTLLQVLYQPEAAGRLDL